MTYTPVPTDPKARRSASICCPTPRPGRRRRCARRWPQAEVGDEQIGDDPTVNLLCERVAELLGKEAAVFMPSGTLCNVTATLAHLPARRRDPGA